MLSLLDEGADAREKVVDHDPSDDDSFCEERVIRCATCGNVLTRPQHRFAVNGRPEHVFTNPHGYVFHIACFREAEGAVRVGEESSEWSWFADHSWRTVVCRACMTHVGWHFGRDAECFWGLILARLVE